MAVLTVQQARGPGFHAVIGSPSGTPLPGSYLDFAPGGAVAVLRKVDGSELVCEIVSGAPVAADTITAREGDWTATFNSQVDESLQFNDTPSADGDEFPNDGRTQLWVDNGTAGEIVIAFEMRRPSVPEGTRMARFRVPAGGTRGLPVLDRALFNVPPNGRAKFHCDTINPAITMAPFRIDPLL